MPDRGTAVRALCAVLLIVCAPVGLAQWRPSMTSLFVRAWVPELARPAVMSPADAVYATAARHALAGRFRSARETLREVPSEPRQRFLRHLFLAEITRRQFEMIGGGRLPLNLGLLATFERIEADGRDLHPGDHPAVQRMAYGDTVTLLAYHGAIFAALIDAPAMTRAHRLVKPRRNAAAAIVAMTAERLSSASADARAYGLLNEAEISFLEALFRARVRAAEGSAEAAAAELERLVAVSPGDAARLLMIEIGDTLAFPDGSPLLLGIDPAAYLAALQVCPSADAHPAAAAVAAARDWYARAGHGAGEEIVRQLDVRVAALALREGGESAHPLRLLQDIPRAEAGDELEWSSRAAAAIAVTDRPAFLGAVDAAAAEWNFGAVASLAYAAEIAAVCAGGARGATLQRMALDAFLRHRLDRAAVETLCAMAGLALSAEQFDRAIVLARQALDLAVRRLPAAEAGYRRYRHGDRQNFDFWIREERRVPARALSVLQVALYGKAVAEQRPDLLGDVIDTGGTGQRLQEISPEAAAMYAAEATRLTILRSLERRAMELFAGYDDCSARIAKFATLRDEALASGEEVWILSRMSLLLTCPGEWQAEWRGRLVAIDIAASVVEAIRTPDVPSATLHKAVEVAMARANALRELGDGEASERAALRLAEIFGAEPTLLRHEVTARLLAAAAQVVQERPRDALQTLAAIRSGPLQGYIADTVQLRSDDVAIAAEAMLCACGAAECDPMRGLLAFERTRVLRANARALRHGTAVIEGRCIEETVAASRAARGAGPPPSLYVDEDCAVGQAPLAGPPAEALDDILAHLPSGTTVLTYWPHPQGLAVWKAQRNAIALYNVPVSPVELDARLQALQEAVLDRTDCWGPAAAAVAEVVFHPFEPFAPGETLVIVAAGRLARTPFDVLPYRGLPLIASHAVIQADRIGIRDQTGPRRTSPAFVCGVDSGTLRMAEEEAAEVAARLGTVALLPPHVSAEAVSTGMRNAAFVHLAMHASLSPHEPLESSLVLGPRLTLRAWELFRDARAAELVTLSACSTAADPSPARGLLVSQEEATSIAAFAFAANARFVLASLWPARDDLTPPLMTAFYDAVAAEGVSARALQQAKLALFTRGMPRPYYFSGFTLAVRDVAALTEAKPN